MSSQTDQRANENSSSSIISFYAGKSIFITGGTGFMGKVLIEKLLRSCPDIMEIFLLIRPKKGINIDDRVRNMLSISFFEKLRDERPEFLAKIIPVMGDVSMEDLGLSEVDRRVIIDRVSIIFHVAANVRFDEDLKKDIVSNTKSTRDICIMAKSMKKLVAFVHVSSTYAHTDKLIVMEKTYPGLTDWKKIIKIVENMDEDTVRIFTKKLTEPMPNTYTFSKRLAEQVVQDYSKDLPSVIFRPSIVVSTVDEPMSGWLDNFNGPIGLMVGGGKGILRVIYHKNDQAQDYVPVDIAIKAMIAAAWKRGLETVTEDPTAHVYNCASNNIHRIVTTDLVKLALRLNEKVPLENPIMTPRVITTRIRFIYYILNFLLHIFPAVIIDGILRLSGHRPLLFQLQKRIFSASVQLRHFLENEWVFKNEKFLDLLLHRIPKLEEPIFAYDLKSFHIESYFMKALIGVKIYLLKEDMKNLETAKKRFNRIRWIDRIFNAFLLVALVWLVHRFDVTSYVLRVLSNIIGI